MKSCTVFVTGGTGYIGRRLISLLLERGHRVRALVRESSRKHLPDGCTPIAGDAFRKESFVGQIRQADTFVQLIGITHPSPAKVPQFRTIDLASASTSVSAAVEAGVRHFIYVSVAHPAPIMKEYQQARIEAEGIVRASGLHATILRPWYVLGPGRRWPLIVAPIYWLFEMIPATRAAAERLGFVSIDQMLAALVHAVEHPSETVTVLEVPQIRQSSLKV